MQPLLSSSFGMAACEAKNMPVTLTRNSRSKSTSSVSSIFPTSPMPALFTRISSCFTFENASRTAGSSVMSSMSTLAPGSSAASASARARSTSAMITEAPAAARARQVDSPMRLAPVVSQVHPDPAELAQKRRALRHYREHIRPGIFVHVLKIAPAPIFPAAGRIHEARRIERLHPAQDFVGVMLPPALVEGNPHGD